MKLSLLLPNLYFLTTLFHQFKLREDPFTPGLSLQVHIFFAKIEKKSKKNQKKNLSRLFFRLPISQASKKTHPKKLNILMN